MNQRTQERLATINQRNQERLAATNQRNQERWTAINQRNQRNQERLTTINQRNQERLAAINQRNQERLAAISQRNQERWAAMNQRSQERFEIHKVPISAKNVRSSSYSRLSDRYKRSAFATKESHESPTIFWNASDGMDAAGHSYSAYKSRSSSSTESGGCFRLSLAHEFIASLIWSNTIFDTRFDRCYCSSCYKYNWKDVLQAGDGLYVIPRDWVRLGIQVDSVTAELNDIWNCWRVTYHGTSVDAAIAIIKSRQFSIPGDQLLDGSFLAIRPGHIPRKQYIYSSPTIAYSSLPVYCPVYDFTANNNEHYRVKIVLACRQDPKLMHIQGETVGSGTTRICPYIPNGKIEYFTEARASLVPYG
ncbi:unnamed protein product, partial [Rotaria sordida]